LRNLKEVVVDIDQAITDELTVAVAFIIRQWAKEHIHKPRVLGEQLRSAPDLAEAFRKDARSAQVKLAEVEEESRPPGEGH
jgi:hypothetical protein